MNPIAAPLNSAVVALTVLFTMLPPMAARLSAQTSHDTKRAAERYQIRLPHTERTVRPAGQAAKLLGAEAPLTLEAVREQAPGVIKESLSLDQFTFDEEATSSLAGKTIITYSMRYRGIPLTRRSSATLILGPRLGEAQAIRLQNVPERGVVTTEPTIDKKKAVQFATADFQMILDELDRQKPEGGAKLANKNIHLSDPQLVIEPSNANEQGQQFGLLAWNFALEVDYGMFPYKIEYSVAATGELRIITRLPLLYHSHEGTVAGSRWDPTPIHQPVQGPLPFARVRRDDGEHVQADANGHFSFNGTGHANFTAELVTRYFVIQNAAGNGQVVTATGMGNHTASISLLFQGSSEFEVAQVSAFYWAHQAREFCSSILGSDDLSPMTVRVNLNSSCNAWFQAPNTIGLFRSSAAAGVSTDQCVNRAYQDTIFHEFGHAVDYVCGGIADGAYSEGFGDAIAILYSRADCYGRDTRGAGTCLRKADNDLRWPSQGSGIHQRGTIYSGFVWQLVQELMTMYTEDEAYAIAKDLVLGAARLNPHDIQHAVQLSLEIDDDDGDLSNGTPHIGMIKSAADAKGLWKDEWNPRHEPQ